MAKIIEFPNVPQESTDSESYNLTGHTLMLDMRKASRFQCFNFFLGTRNKVGIIPENTDHYRIHSAIQSGVLVDLEDHPEFFTSEKSIAEVHEEDTGKKFYSGTVKFFRELGLTEPCDTVDEETVAFATDDPEVQQRIEEALKQVSVSAAPPISPIEARQRIRRPLIELPPGFDDPERYLIR